MDWFVIAIIAGIICLLFFLNRKKQADHEFALKMMSPPAEDHSRSKVEHALSSVGVQPLFQRSQLKGRVSNIR